MIWVARCEPDAELRHCPTPDGNSCQVIQGAVDQARGNLPCTGRVCRHAWLDNMLLNDSVDRSKVGAMSDLAAYMPVEPGLKVGHELGVPRHRRWLCDMPLERRWDERREGQECVRRCSSRGTTT